MPEKNLTLTESIEYLITKLLTAEGYMVSKVKLELKTRKDQILINNIAKLTIKAKKVI